MNATGQLARLFRHLGYYAEHFDLTYVTWGDPETERRLWQPFEDKTGARLVAAHRYAALRDCDVLRCLNLHATMAAMPTRRPYVMSYGADYPALAAIHGRPAWKWKALRAVAVRRARTVLVPNETMAFDLMDRYPYAGIVHHPNWVDCEMFAPRGPRRSSRGYNVLYVGRLVKEKNLETLASVVRRLDPPAGLVCVGEGPLKARLIELGATCPGAEAWENLPLWYRGADVFALPSLSEGHPKVLTEAMACFPSETFVSARGVIAWHRRRYSGPLVVIRTSRGVVRATPEHPFMTDTGWVPASRLTPRHRLVYHGTHETTANSEKRQSYVGRIGDFEALVLPPNRRADWRGAWAHATVDHLARDAARTKEIILAAGHVQDASLIADAMGLSRRSRGRGGDSNYSQGGPRVEAASGHLQYIDGTDGLVGESSPNAVRARASVWFGPGGPTGPNAALYVSGDRDCFLAVLQETTSAFSHQRPPDGSRHRVDATTTEANLARGVLATTSRDCPTYPGSEYQAITEVTAVDVIDLPVYNFTTTSGVYRAGNYLVHNCGMPCLVSQAVTEGGFAVLRTDDLAAGLRRLLEPKLADEYAAAARAWALSRWDVKVLMPREIGYLREAAR